MNSAQSKKSPCQRVPLALAGGGFFACGHIIIEKCIIRSGENNHHVHDGYGKEKPPSSNVNDTDKDTDEYKSNKSIVHDLFDEPSSKNLIMEERKSECNIVNETLLQSY